MNSARSRRVVRVQRRNTPRRCVYICGDWRLWQSHKRVCVEYYDVWSGCTVRVLQEINSEPGIEAINFKAVSMRLFDALFPVSAHECENRIFACDYRVYTCREDDDFDAGDVE